ncbi:MAG: hypothetical protein CMN76_00620 [Spirochaetaceae bacterium]|nr:hypothetical protein [Spirochaetaceae bacterium]
MLERCKGQNEGESDRAWARLRLHRSRLPGFRIGRIPVAPVLSALVKRQNQTVFSEILGRFQ